MISGVKHYCSGWGAGVVMYRVRARAVRGHFTADHPPTTKSTPPGPASGTRTAAVGGILGSAVVVAEWGEIIRARPAASMPVRLPPVRLPAIQRPVLGMRQMLSRHEGRSAPRSWRGSGCPPASQLVHLPRQHAPPHGTWRPSSLREERSAPCPTRDCASRRALWAVRRPAPSRWRQRTWPGGGERRRSPAPSSPPPRRRRARGPSR